MASAAFPSVVTALVSKIGTAVNPTRVVRGRDVTTEPSDLVMVGISSIDENSSDVWASAGTFRQTMQTFGGNREEVGQVNCLVRAQNGDGDQDAACSTAFGYLARVEASLRSDKTLGLTTFDYVVTELSAGDVTESQNDEGATAVLSFTVTYKIRI